MAYNVTFCMAIVASWILKKHFLLKCYWMSIDLAGGFFLFSFRKFSCLGEIVLSGVALPYSFAKAQDKMRKELIQNQEKKNIRLITSLLIFNDALNLFQSAVDFVCKLFRKNIFSEWNSHFRCLFWLLNCTPMSWLEL